MILQEPGPISEHLIFLGDNRVCMYLLMGEKYLLLGGGMSYVVPKIEEQLDHFHIDRSRIMGLLILHSHFDHCTAAPYFKKAYPDWAIMASAGAKKVFGMEKAVKHIARLDLATRNRYGVEERFKGISLEFHPPALFRIVKDGDNIDLGGGVGVTIHETPGHSKCSITVYEPDLKILFPSDAAPLPLMRGGGLMVMANDSLPVYFESLERMAALEVNAVCYEHCGFFIGQDAASVLRKSVELTKEKIVFYHQAIASGADKKDLARSEVAAIVKDSEFDLITDEILMQVCVSMIESVS